jgi:adenylate cyclase
MPRIPRLSASSPRTRLFVGVAIGLFAATVGTFLRRTHAIEGMERRTVDARTVAYVGTRSADPRIVLAVIEEPDLLALKAKEIDWPWDLPTTSYAFRWLAEAGALVVCVDVLQFDRGSGPEEITAGAGQDLTLVEARLKEVPDLVNAYREVRKRGALVLASELTRGAADGDPKAIAVRRPVFDELAKRLPPLPVATDFERAGIGLPVVRLLREVDQVGFANTATDDDGILRRALLVARLGAIRVPSLSLAAVLHATKDVVATSRSLRIAGAEQDLDARGGFYANFRARVGAYPRVSPADMILGFAAWEETDRKGPLPPFGSAVPEAVRGKIVVWGVNAPGFKDVVSAPVAENYPGPEFQATVIDNLLNGDGRVAADPAVNTAILFALAILMGALGGPALPKGAYFGALLAILGAYVLVAYRLFKGGLSLDLVVPLISTAGTYAGVVAFRLLTEGRRNKWLEGTFGQYLSPAVIAALKSNPAMLDLGGRRREISVLFSDVKAFTSISERLSADQLVQLMNDYLTRQSHPILEREGVIDKFIGDAVMAFFGDPVEVPDHALRACRAAVACRRAVADTLPVARSLGIDSISNRIGVNSGPATVGNMGSAERFSYTAMGDTVNFASRLEGANKAFGSSILIGPLTYEQAKDGIVARPIGRLVVVGKREPTLVHELLGIAGETDGETLALCAAYTRAHEAVRRDDLEAARRHLIEATQTRPGDGPSVWLSLLVDDLTAGKRPRPWDGVFVLTEKG